MLIRCLAVWVLLITIGCAGSKPLVYKRQDITPQILNDLFLDKSYAVRMRFYISKSEMFEETGYLKTSKLPGTVIFEYYDSVEKKYQNLEVPFQNISTIEVASKSSKQFGTLQKIATASVFWVSLYFLPA